MFLKMPQNLLFVPIRGEVKLAMAAEIGEKNLKIILYVSSISKSISIMLWSNLKSTMIEEYSRNHWEDWWLENISQKGSVRFFEIIWRWGSRSVSEQLKKNFEHCDIRTILRKMTHKRPWNCFGTYCVFFKYFHLVGWIKRKRSM